MNWKTRIKLWWWDYVHLPLWHRFGSKESKRKIKESLRKLRENLNHKIVHYSYPEGQFSHYDRKVIDFLKKEDIICCPSAICGVNTAEDDLFHLKRIMVGFGGIEFPFS